MKITKAKSSFKPVTITLESREELICMRAVADAARHGRDISMTFIRMREDEGPFVRDAEDFARVLDDRLANDDFS